MAVLRRSPLSGQPRAIRLAPAIPRRMYEFLGGGDLQYALEEYIAAADGHSDYQLLSNPCELLGYLDGAMEVDRSL